MDIQNLADWLRLQATPGVGPRRAAALLTEFGAPDRVFAQTIKTLAAWVPTAVAQALKQSPEGIDARARMCIDWTDRAPESRRILTLACTDYPRALLQLPDPPLLLYCIGPPQGWELQWLNPEHNRCLAVVGSRNPCQQGARDAHNFSRELADHGITIVSGMALGVDGNAHSGALSSESANGNGPGAGACTIAVIGTGPDRVYPSAHRALAQAISTTGFLIGEYPPGVGPLPQHFPQRNRIIAGLSKGTLVVQATLQSGSLITAQLALDGGKDVLAIPGSIHSPHSKGCHALIRQGAKLVDCTQDILDELWPDDAPHTPGTTKTTQSYAPPAPADHPVLHALGFEPNTFDQLQTHTGLGTSALQVALMELELAGHVQRLAGGRFQRIGTS